jgi:hypothetical protein
LYLGGAAGAVAWLVMRRRRSSRLLAWLAVAAVPTALTMVLEWTGVGGVGNVTRALAGVPLGVMIAWVLVQTAAGRTPDVGSPKVEVGSSK